MGSIFVDGVVTGPAGKQANVRFLVDSSVTYTLLPDEVWRDIELRPKRQMDFVLADGTTITRPVSEAHIALAQGDGTSPVILGESGDEALLGMVTLEVMGLVLNPFKRALQPMRAVLA
jgi:predicted aspartyl protease